MYRWIFYIILVFNCYFSMVWACENYYLTEVNPYSFILIVFCNLFVIVIGVGRLIWSILKSNEILLDSLLLVFSVFISVTLIFLNK